MKTLIRFSLLILGVMIVGTTLMFFVEMRNPHLAAADQPAGRNPAPQQSRSKR